jgi:glycosyltransferase involved in cell wall biosynthesis
MPKRVIVSVTNDLASDQRVDRVATTLTKAGIDVILVGRKLSCSILLKDRIYSTHLFSLLFRKGFLFYATYNIRLFIFLLFRKADALLSNDLDTLPANFFASRLKRIPLLFDSHEYFPEVPELVKKRIVKKIWVFIEQFFLPRIEYSYTVCDSIAGVYEEKYNIKPFVIRNLPYRKSEKTKNKTNSVLRYDNKKIVFYQGSLNIGRGLELMLEVMKFLKNTVFIIAGEGDISSILREKVSEQGLEEKVVFLGRIPIHDLNKHTSYADLGISLEENMGLNYYYALPNKLFDYIQAHVPVLVSDFPEMSAIVNKYNVGVSTNEKDPEKLAFIIENIFKDQDRYNQWKINLEIAATELCWENEEKKLLELFRLAGLI